MNGSMSVWFDMNKEILASITTFQMQKREPPQQEVFKEITTEFSNEIFFSLEFITELQTLISLISR